MELSNCPKCRRLFPKVKESRLCSECSKAEEDQFEILRRFIQDNPKSTIGVVSNATGVSPKRILLYVREGRLILSEGMMGELKCSQCETPIEKGSMCDKCSREISKGFEEALKESNDNAKKQEAAAKNVGMYTTDIRKKK
jgi:hypothetical protein